MDVEGHTDKEILGEKAEYSHDETAEFSRLTEEELRVEKKLRRKIDVLIMPLVILVYLMNYIDRSVVPIMPLFPHNLDGLETITLPHVCKASRKLLASPAPSIKQACPSYL